MDLFKSFMDGVNLPKTQAKLDLELAKIKSEVMSIRVTSIMELMNVATKLTELTISIAENPNKNVCEDKYLKILKEKGVAELFKAYLEFLAETITHQ